MRKIGRVSDRVGESAGSGSTTKDVNAWKIGIFHRRRHVAPYLFDRRRPVRRARLRE
jgi:hypothetical protein